MARVCIYDLSGLQQKETTAQRVLPELLLLTTESHAASTVEAIR
jgi:hypothetical protein